MDNAFREQVSDMQPRRGSGAALQILDRLENWLAHILELTWLTDEEQESAGIYLSRPSDGEEATAGTGPDNPRNG
jgi:hypothetical protein